MTYYVSSRTLNPTHSLTSLNAQSCVTGMSEKPTVLLQKLANCVQLCYAIQHRTVLIIFPFIPQTIIIAQTFSDGGEGRIS